MNLKVITFLSTKGLTHLCQSCLTKLAGCKDFNTSGTNLKPLEQINISLNILFNKFFNLVKRNLIVIYATII